MKHRYGKPKTNLLQTLDFKNSIDQITAQTSHQLSSQSYKQKSLNMFQTFDFETSQMKRIIARNRIPEKSIKQVIDQKFRTFVNWSALKQYRQFKRKIKLTSRQKKRNKSLDKKGINDSSNILNALVIFTFEMEKKKKREQILQNKRNNRQKNAVNIKSMDESEAILAEKRQRLMKIKNPLGIVHHFKQHTNYSPTTFQQILIKKLIQLRVYLESQFQEKNSKFKTKECISPDILKSILEKIYELMNYAVDYNQMRLLIILVILAADISFLALDYKRSFYFFRQATIAADFGKMLELKISALLGMAKITYELEDVENTVLFLKKALSYAWLIGNIDIQMSIYEKLGKTYFLNGSTQKARYYYSRYTQNQYQSHKSASRLICIEILNDYRKRNKYHLYDNNISLLFIQTLNLPIKNFSHFPKNKQASGNFQNYINGDSPRKSKDENSRSFEDQYFPELLEQIKQYTQKDAEFQKDMPDPNVSEGYVPTKIKKNKREIQFERSVQYHLISDKREHTKTKSARLSLPETDSVTLKMPLDKRVQNLLQHKPNQNFFQDMKHNIKMDKLYKVGDLKERVCKSHLKVSERKRALSTHSDKIKFTLNKALIDWIDPKQ